MAVDGPSRQCLELCLEDAAGYLEEWADAAVGGFADGPAVDLCDVGRQEHVSANGWHVGRFRFVDGVVPHLLDRGDRLDYPGSSTPCYLKKPGDAAEKYWRVSCGSVGGSTITRSNTIFSRNAMSIDGKDYRIARFVINLKPIVDVQ